MTSQTGSGSGTLWDGTLEPSPARDPVSIVGLIVLLVVIGTTAGVSGTLIAIPFVVFALFVPATVAFLAGQFSLLVTIHAESLSLILVVQFLLLAVLTEPAREHNANAVVSVTALMFLALVGIVTSLAGRSLVTAGVGLVFVVGATVYVVHRYELVQLGLVESSRGRVQPPDEEPLQDASEQTPSAATKSE